LKDAKEGNTMMKYALLVFAGTETHEGLGRLVNALEIAREFHEAGDEAVLVFDGAGTQGLAELSKPEHKAHGLLESARGQIRGACSYCANAFGVKSQLQEAGFPLLADYKNHPSVHALARDGYTLMTL